eukprot:TRINITY_DN25772_c5_g1_i1.p1 TRINITY_DN25772_c5_g1~~TRINITY_DN25772_c5_g1_i1.p1  ORF type:complete len:266 (-),score=72.41 TRINITY_DN25772_c5_g1_i1:93-827(-)
MAKKKKKRPPQEEGPPDASLADRNEVLLAGTKKSGAAPASAGASKAAKATPGVIKSSLKASKKAAAGSKAEASSSKAAPKPVTFDGAKLTLDLLEASTTQLLRRKGWFRDVRLRRSADAFMQSSKLHQRATSRWWSEQGGKGYEKPTPAELTAYEEELQRHLESLRGKLGAAPMNERREISLAAAGPGKVIGAKLKGLKARASELEKKPRSVIKGSMLQKKRKVKGAVQKAKEVGGEAGGDGGT